MVCSLPHAFEFHPALAIIDRQFVFASGSTIVLCSQTSSALACIVRHVRTVTFTPCSTIISTAHVGIYGAICIQELCTSTLKQLNKVLLCLACNILICNVQCHEAHDRPITYVFLLLLTISIKWTVCTSITDTSGSCGLITRRKDFHAPTRDFPYPDVVGDDTRIATADMAELYNPKQEVLRQAFTDKDSTASGEFELLDNIWLSSWQHGYFVAGADHNLTLTIGQNFEQDLLHSIDFKYKTLTEAAGPPVTYTPAVQLDPAYTRVVCGVLPADADCEAGKVYVEIMDVALHCAFAGSVPSIPPSVALKFSELQISKHALTQQQTEISQVVPPSTRAIYIFSNQLVHDIRADAEELGLAGAGVDELGLTKGTGAGHPTTQPHVLTNLICELGGQLQPSNGGYNNMDVAEPMPVPVSHRHLRSVLFI